MRHISLTEKEMDALYSMSIYIENELINSEIQEESEMEGVFSKMAETIYSILAKYKASKEEHPILASCDAIGRITSRQEMENQRLSRINSCLIITCVFLIAACVGLFALLAMK